MTAETGGRHRKDLSAELAGDSPCLIFADADLEQATDSALFGAFALNGQRRTASSAILAERSSTTRSSAAWPCEPGAFAQASRLTRRRSSGHS